MHFRRFFLNYDVHGGHFVFGPCGNCSRVPKWHPVDFDLGWSIDNESTKKRRPPSKTRSHAKSAFGKWTILFVANMGFNLICYGVV